jgi:hypothetical protein
MAAEAQQVGGGIRDIDINGVDLADGRQGRRLLGRDQRALGDGRCADQPADRRTHFGEVEADLRRLDGRLGRGDVGLGLRQRRLGVVEALCGDRVDADQLVVAIDLGLRARQGGFRLLQGRCGRVIGGLVAARIDLVEEIAGLDGAALGEDAALDEAVDLRPDIGDGRGRGAARNLDRQRNRFSLQRDGADLDGRAAAGWAARRGLFGAG